MLGLKTSCPTPGLNINVLNTVLQYLPPSQSPLERRQSFFPSHAQAFQTHMVQRGFAFVVAEALEMERGLQACLTIGLSMHMPGSPEVCFSWDEGDPGFQG